MFEHLIVKTVEVYIDDMLIKSVGKENHLRDLREVLGILYRDRLRLNASKCIFGVSSGKFLGHMISYKGIEANPDQISVLLNLEPPRDQASLVSNWDDSHSWLVYFLVGGEMPSIFPTIGEEKEVSLGQRLFGCISRDKGVSLIPSLPLNP